MANARGTIAIVSAKGRDMWELVELQPTGDGFAIIAFDDNLKLFSFTTAVIEAIRTSTAACAGTN